MENLMKKTSIGIVIAVFVSFIVGWRIMIFIGSIIESVVSFWDLISIVTVFLILAVPAGIVFLILWFSKKQTRFFHLLLLSVVLSVSSGYLASSYSSSDVSPLMENNYYFVNKYNSCGVIDHFGNEIYPFEYDSYLRFYQNNQYGLGVLKKGSMYYLANKKGDVILADPLVYNDESALYKKDRGFVCMLDNKFYLINEKGELVISSGFDSYLRDYFNQNVLWIKKGEKWGAFDFGKAKSLLVTYKYDNCQYANNGMILKGGNDVFFAQWDQGSLLFYNLSEQERERERQQYNNILFMMMFNQMNSFNNMQISQMNNLYQNYGVRGRSRDQIKRDLDHLRELQTQAHGSGGIAESIGYNRIQSTYQQMITEREREYQMADH